MRNHLFGAWMTTLLVACATPAPSSTARETPQTTVRPPAAPTADIPRAGLPSQTLNEGQCGLFLWSQTDISKFVFFARAGERSALFLLNNQPADVSLAAAGGDIFGQFLTELEYLTQDNVIRIRIKYTPGEELVGGARVASGRISYTDPEGWSRVLPVLGARACQDVPNSALP